MNFFFKNFIFFSFLTSMLFISCKAHVPTTGEIPGAAPLRWKRSKRLLAIADSYRKSDSSGYNNNLAKGILLAISSHSKFQKSEDRKSVLIKIAKKFELLFLLKRLETPSIHKTSKLPIYLYYSGSAQWTKFKKTKFGKRATALWETGKGGSAEFTKILKVLLKSPLPDYLAPVLALKAASMDIKVSLNEKEWTRLLYLCAFNMGETRIPPVFKWMKKQISKKMLDNIFQKSTIFYPSITRLWSKTADFQHLWKIATGSNLIFPYNNLIPLLKKLKRNEFNKIGAIFLMGGPAVLKYPFKDALLESERLRLMGKIKESVSKLETEKPGMDFKKRLLASRYSLQFKDMPAAIKHLKWAISLLETEKLRSKQYPQLRKLLRLFGKSDFEWTKKEYNINKAEVIRDLAGNYNTPEILKLIPKGENEKKKISLILKQFKQRFPYSNMMKYWKFIEKGKSNFKNQKHPSQFIKIDNKRSNINSTNAIRWETKFIQLIKTRQSYKKWKQLVNSMGKSPWLIPLAEYILWHYNRVPEFLLVAAEALIRVGKLHRAEMVFEEIESITPDPVKSIIDRKNLLLKYGLRRESALAMRDLMVYKTMWSSPIEAQRTDLRISAYLSLINFYFKAGFTQKGNSLVKKLIKHASIDSPFRKYSIEQLILKKHPKSLFKLNNISGNPLFALYLAAKNRRTKDISSILKSLDYIFPYNIRIGVLLCYLGNNQYCESVIKSGSNSNKNELSYPLINNELFYLISGINPAKSKLSLFDLSILLRFNIKSGELLFLKDKFKTLKL